MDYIIEQSYFLASCIYSKGPSPSCLPWLLFITIRPSKNAYMIITWNIIYFVFINSFIFRLCCIMLFNNNNFSTTILCLPRGLGSESLKNHLFCSIVHTSIQMYVTIYVTFNLCFRNLCQQQHKILSEKKSYKQSYYGYACV